MSELRQLWKGQARAKRSEILRGYIGVKKIVCSLD